MAKTPIAGGVNLATAYPSATFEQDGKGFALGDQVAAGGGGGIWFFCKCATSMSIGSVVAIDDAFLATKITKALADLGCRVGVVPVVVAAANDYVWVQVSGVIANALVLLSCAIDVPLYTTATAGSLDDTSTSQTKINGIKLTTARGGTDGVAPAIGYNGGINASI